MMIGAHNYLVQALRDIEYTIGSRDRVWHKRSARSPAMPVYKTSGMARPMTVCTRSPVRQKPLTPWSHRTIVRNKSDHLLTGLLFDDAGHRMIPTHLQRLAVL